ncbi:AlbA family DNA-binding domain-containing protein [Pseudanabaena minima]|uniref:AlbA family DNA-binding domain-containing protein n=1 Tax=Pseudanabaena minima TaxID=890415 RepID=UPI003DA82B56
MSENIDFSEIVERIFQIDPTNPEFLITGETTELEFKTSFHSQTNKWDDYGRTIAAFANNLGGCLVFGIKPEMPHPLIGMQNDSFENLDSEQLASYLNSRFSPEILFRKYIHQIENKKFGLIYVKKCYFRPVVATKNGEDGKTIRESDIFYRYEARSERIKYSELIQIIDERRQREQDMWMQHLRKIASIGVENAAIFNPDDGTVSGNKGTFVIDSELLSKISFIREGEFQEVSGKIGVPTLKIVGDVEILAAAGEIKRNVSTEKERITCKDIFEDFLLQKKPNQPRLYLEQACYEDTWFLPIYYYAFLAEFDIEKLKEVIDTQESIRNTKKQILVRINTGDKSLFKDISGSSQSESQHKKLEFRQSFISQSFSSEAIDEISNDEQQIQYALSSLQSLKSEEIDIDYIFPILHLWLGKWYFNENSKPITRTNFNKAVCHLDKEMFFQKLTKIE